MALTGLREIAPCQEMAANVVTLSPPLTRNISRPNGGRGNPPSTRPTNRSLARSLPRLPVSVFLPRYPRFCGLPDCVLACVQKACLWTDGGFTKLKRWEMFLVFISQSSLSKKLFLFSLIKKHPPSVFQHFFYFFNNNKNIFFSPSFSPFVFFFFSPRGNK